MKFKHDSLLGYSIEIGQFVIGIQFYLVGFEFYSIRVPKITDNAHNIICFGFGLGRAPSFQPMYGPAGFINIGNWEKSFHWIVIKKPYPDLTKMALGVHYKKCLELEEKEKRKIKKCPSGHSLKVIGHSCCDDVCKCKCGKWFVCGLGSIWKCEGKND